MANSVCVAMIVGAALAGGTPAGATEPEQDPQGVLDGTVASERTGRGAPGYADGPAQAGDPHRALQDAVERLAADPLVPGAHLYAEGPRVGTPFAGAAGSTALVGGAPLHPADTGRLASTTKTFTAVAILRLAEDGRLSLDDRVSQRLEPGLAALIPNAERMTIRMLLNHTSGMAAHDEDPRYLAQVAAMPRRRWTAREQIELAMQTPPHFEPGAGQRYSDTGYVVLGQIIERVTGRNLGAAVRELLDLTRLGLQSTWWELFEAAPSGARARVHEYQYVYDIHGHDPSFDSFGGGGLVSNPSDLARFMRALFADRVFRHKRTLTTMLDGEVPTVPVLGVPQVGYAYGLARLDFDGVSCWGHPGHWGSFAAYCPTLDVALGGMTHQNRNSENKRPDVALWSAAVEVLRNAAAPAAAPAGERLTVGVRPRRLRVGRPARLRLTVRRGTEPVRGARVAVARRRVRTSATGVATLRLTLRRRQTYPVRVCVPRRCVMQRVEGV